MQTTGSTSIPRGRRRTKQSISTRESILDASEGMFGELGYDGASMRALARASKTSQALLHHHFGTKEGLYTAVTARVEERMKGVVEELDTLLSTGSDVGAFVSGLTCYLAFLRESPNVLRLQQWRRIRGDEHGDAWYAGVLRTLRSHLQRLADTGNLPATADVDKHAALLVSVANYWAENHGELRRLLGIEDTPAAFESAYAEYVSKLLLG